MFRNKLHIQQDPRRAKTLTAQYFPRNSRRVSSARDSILLSAFCRFKSDGINYRDERNAYIPSGTIFELSTPILIKTARKCYYTSQRKRLLPQRVFHAYLCLFRFGLRSDVEMQFLWEIGVSM